MNQYQPVTPPGVKNDRGRLVLILFVGAILLGMFAVWPHLENFWDDLMVEISGEFGFPYESRYDKERQEESVMPDLFDETTPMEEPEPTTPSETIPESDFNVTTESNFDISTYNLDGFTVNSELGDDATRQIMQEARQQIIDEMIANGQQAQIPIVLQMLDQMEEQY